MSDPFAASKMCPTMERAISGEKTMGTCCVVTERAPSLRRVRRAASAPMDSGDSSAAAERALEYQWSRCIWPLADCAMGLAEMEQMERRYSPMNPRELARILCPPPESKEPPRLLVMRGSAAKHAASARRAYAMRSAAGNSATSSE